MIGARVTFIQGARGSGKSTLAKKLVASAPRLLVFDVLRNTDLPRMTVTVSLEDVRRRLLRDYRKGFRICYRPPLGVLPQALSETSRLLLAVCRAGGAAYDVAFYVEEMSLCFPEEKLPATARGFFDMCLVGRHARIGIVGVAQRAALVSKAFVGNTDETYIFRPNGAADYRMAEELTGREHAGTIRALVNFDYIHADHTTGRVTAHRRNRR